MYNFCATKTISHCPAYKTIAPFDIFKNPSYRDIKIILAQVGQKASHFTSAYRSCLLFQVEFQYVLNFKQPIRANRIPQELDPT